MSSSNTPNQVEGVEIRELAENPTRRIAWTPPSDIIMYAHLARGKVPRRLVKTRYFDELCVRLNCAFGGDFANVVRPKIVASLVYKINKLVRDGVLTRPVSGGNTDEIYPEWTARWAEPAWDGDISKPALLATEPSYPTVHQPTAEPVFHTGIMTNEGQEMEWERSHAYEAQMQPAVMVQQMDERPSVLFSSQHDLDNSNNNNYTYPNGESAFATRSPWSPLASVIHVQQPAAVCSNNNTTVWPSPDLGHAPLPPPLAAWWQQPSLSVNNFSTARSSIGLAGSMWANSNSHNHANPEQMPPDQGQQQQSTTHPCNAWTATIPTWNQQVWDEESKIEVDRRETESQHAEAVARDHKETADAVATVNATQKQEMEAQQEAREAAMREMQQHAEAEAVANEEQKKEEMAEIARKAAEEIAATKERLEAHFAATQESLAAEFRAAQEMAAQEIAAAKERLEADAARKAVENERDARERPEADIRIAHRMAAQEIAVAKERLEADVARKAAEIAIAKEKRKAKINKAKEKEKREAEIKATQEIAVAKERREAEVKAAQQMTKAREKLEADIAVAKAQARKEAEQRSAVALREQQERDDAMAEIAAARAKLEADMEAAREEARKARSDMQAEMIRAAKEEARKARSDMQAEMIRAAKEEAKKMLVSSPSPSVISARRPVSSRSTAGHPYSDGNSMTENVGKSHPIVYETSDTAATAAATTAAAPAASPLRLSREELEARRDRLSEDLEQNISDCMTLGLQNTDSGSGSDSGYGSDSGRGGPRSLSFIDGARWLMSEGRRLEEELERVIQLLLPLVGGEDVDVDVSYSEVREALLGFPDGL